MRVIGQKRRQGSVSSSIGTRSPKEEEATRYSSMWALELPPEPAREIPLLGPKTTLTKALPSANQNVSIYIHIQLAGSLEAIPSFVNSHNICSKTVPTAHHA